MLSPRAARPTLSPPQILRTPAKVLHTGDLSLIKGDGNPITKHACGVICRGLFVIVLVANGVLDVIAHHDIIIIVLVVVFAVFVVIVFICWASYSST